MRPSKSNFLIFQFAPVHVHVHDPSHVGLRLAHEMAATKDGPTRVHSHVLAPLHPEHLEDEEVDMEIYAPDPLAGEVHLQEIPTDLTRVLDPVLLSDEGIGYHHAEGPQATKGEEQAIAVAAPGQEVIQFAQVGRVHGLFLPDRDPTLAPCPIPPIQDIRAVGVALVPVLPVVAREAIAGMISGIAGRGLLESRTFLTFSSDVVYLLSYVLCF